MAKKTPMAFKLRPEIVSKLRKASTAKPIPYSMTAIVERGIELALREIKKGVAAR